MSKSALKVMPLFVSIFNEFCEAVIAIRPGIAFFVIEAAKEFHGCRAEIGWGKKSLEYVAVGPLI